MNARCDGRDVVIVDIFLTTGSGLGVLAGMVEFASPPKRVVSHQLRDRRHAVTMLGLRSRCRLRQIQLDR